MTRPDVIPIPLRADVVAHIHIPLDLTEAEARKIAAVVLAYASVDTHAERGDAKQAPSDRMGSAVRDSADAQNQSKPPLSGYNR